MEIGKILHLKMKKKERTTGSEVRAWLFKLRTVTYFAIAEASSFFELVVSNLFIPDAFSVLCVFSFYVSAVIAFIQ